LLPLTPERLAGVYEMLRSFPPFCRWRLPHFSEVKFHVAKTDQWHAAWWIDGDRHNVEVSEKKHGRIDSLIESMAHEMIHIRQRVNKTETKGEHNAEYKRLAKQVCKAFGFDYGQFGG
jgi:hypothetical protein